MQINLIRLKSFSGKLYYDSYIMPKIGAYNGVYVNYFIDLFRRFSKYIPDFDITIFTSDSREYKFNWKDRNSSLCFMAEGMHDESVSVGLHTISRSFLRAIYTNDVGKRKSQDQIFNITKHVHQNYFLWKNKINKAVFRGSPFLDNRDELVYFMNYNASNWLGQYFDVKLIHHPIRSKAQPRKKFCGKFEEYNKSKCWVRKENGLSWTDELKYKYLIVIDGLGVRDAFTRQLRYNSVILKHHSRRKEFWYYDLIDKHHYFEYKNTTHLVNLMTQFQNGYYTENQLLTVANNGYEYTKRNFNSEKLDCFTIHMLNLYNYFFYNSSSITINEHDVEIPWYNDKITLHSRKPTTTIRSTIGDTYNWRLSAHYASYYLEHQKTFKGETPNKMFKLLLQELLQSHKILSINIIDVGANQGQFLSSKWITDHTQNMNILLIEPNPLLIESLKEQSNKFMAQHKHIQIDIDVMNIALSDEYTASKHPVFYVDSANIQLSRLNQPNLPGPAVSEVNISVVTLNDILKEKHRFVDIKAHQFKLLNIDTEGFDVTVLYGAHKYISKFDLVIFQCSDLQFKRNGPGTTIYSSSMYFEKYGFDVYILGNPKSVPISTMYYSPVYDNPTNMIWQKCIAFNIHSEFYQALTLTIQTPM